MIEILIFILALLSWLVYRSKLAIMYKAIFTVVPIAVVQVFIGISFYHRPFAVYSIGTLFALGALFYLYRTKKPWLYFFSVIFVSVSLLVMGILEVDI